MSDNGNILSKYGIGENEKTIIGYEYYTTVNFRKMQIYEFLNKNQAELFSKDNYELLAYLENNYSRYYGPKDKNVPLLKKQE
jgi:hypothetical protein